MSKCWYCNNELTSNDSPKHFGICNKCYDKMFKSGDTIIRSLTNKISDLEAKLAESEKKAYSRGHSQRDIANEIKLNALREDVANKEKRIVELKQQLAEKDKEIEKYINANMIIVGRRSQGKKHLMQIKIKELQNQKAIEQLEQIINLFEPYENEEKDTILCANNGISFLEYIDNQIEELKKEMK